MIILRILFHPLNLNYSGESSSIVAGEWIIPWKERINYFFRIWRNLIFSNFISLNWISRLRINSRSLCNFRWWISNVFTFYERHVWFSTVPWILNGINKGQDNLDFLAWKVLIHCFWSKKCASHLFKRNHICK